jgi:hypothetical protein
MMGSTERPRPAVESPPTSGRARSSGSWARRGVAAVSAAALVFGLQGAGAQELGEPLGQRQLVNGLPESISPTLDLAAAQIREFSLDDAEREFVVYCFGDRIQEIVDPQAFSLTSFDPGIRVRAEVAGVIDVRPQCVLAGFPSGTNLAAYPLASVQTGAIEDPDGEINIGDSASLGGGRDIAGVTSKPELTGVSVQQTRNVITYFFDTRQLVEGGGPFGDQDRRGRRIPVGPGSDAPADASRFGFYTPDGDVSVGTEIVTVEDNAVTVAFPGSGEGAQVSEAARFAVLPDAVVNVQGQGNLMGAVGGDTFVPDLVDVRRTATGAQLDFIFDEPVENAAPNAFFAYSGTGDRIRGTTFSRPRANVVRVTFAGLQDVRDQLVRAAAAPGAVTGLSASGDRSTVGAAAFGTLDRGIQGRTAGPDLVGLEVDENTGEATYVFDEPVSQRQIGLLQQSIGEREALGAVGDRGIQGATDLPSFTQGFYLVTSAGDVVLPRRVVSIGDGEVVGRRVTLLFDSSVAQAADSGGVLAGTVQGLLGNTNPIYTIPVSA